MIVLNMNSGLGNQMFHYAFYLSLVKHNPETKILCNESIYESAGMERKYDIERIFTLSIPTVREFLPETKYKQYVEYEKKVVNRLPNNWLSKAAFLSSQEFCTVMCEAGENSWIRITDLVSPYEKSFKYDVLLTLKRTPVLADVFYKIKKQEKNYNMREFYSEIHKATNVDNTRLADKEYLNSLLCVPEKENRYYIGNFECGSVYFASVEDEVRTAFTFPELDEKNAQIAEQMAECESVAIHLRRGDHLISNDVLFKKGGYYDRAVTRIKELVANPAFYLFSDDLRWCRENYTELGLASDDKIFFVDGNTGLDSYKDMQLMSLCHHNVIPISTFSWWASYLNQYSGKIVIAPKGYWCDASIYL